MPHTVAKILERKGSDVATVAPDISLSEAVRLLTHRGVGALVVSHNDVAVLGILSERDVVWELLGHGKDAHSTPVSEVMTPEPSCATEDMTVEQALSFMTGKRFRHLPVVKEGVLVGIISIGDLTKWVIRDQEHTIEDLMRYIYDEPA